MATSPSFDHDMGGLIVLFGGRSEIGLATVAKVAAGRPVVLAVRPGPAEHAIDQCRKAGASAVHVIDFDADAIATHAQVVSDIEATFGPISLALLAFGVLGEQTRDEVDHVRAAAVLTTDFVAQASLLTVLSATMLPRHTGTIVAFSSVAGVRVRRANYVYGSAKAGLDGFCAGLTDRLHGSGVCLITARPGFVIGQMTAGMKPAIFSRTAEQVADAVAGAIRERRAGALWIPWQLRLLFLIAAVVPRPIWRRMPR